MIEQFIAVAVLTEALVESLQWLQVEEETGERGWNSARISALLVGVVLAVVTGTNALRFVGLEPAGFVPAIAWEAVGILATSLIVMRGATFIHDLIGRINSP